MKGLKKCYILCGNRNTEVNMGHCITSIRICPLFCELKKGDLFTPSPLYGPMSPSQQFFLTASHIKLRFSILTLYPVLGLDIIEV